MLARSKILLSAALIASTAALAATAQAKTYNITFAGGHGTHLPWMKAIKEFYIPEVDKRLAAAGGKDKIVWTEAFGGTLAKVGGVLEAVQEGVADMGMVYTIFEPAKLPLMSVTFMAPFGSYDVTLISKIMVEMNAEMPELKAHWAKQNQVFLGDIAADTDHTWTKFPVQHARTTTRAASSAPPARCRCGRMASARSPCRAISRRTTTTSRPASMTG